MPENTYFTDHQTIQIQAQGQVEIIDTELDFVKNPVKAGDTVRVLRIPKNAIVKGTDQIIITPCNAGITAGIGDGTTATLFDAAIALDAAADTHTGTDPAIETVLAAMNGKLYTEDGYIVMTPSGALTSGKIWIAAEVKLLNRPAA